MVHDKNFFQAAQPACLGDRVVGGGPVQDVPGDGVLNFSCFSCRFIVYSNICGVSVMAWQPCCVVLCEMKEGVVFTS